MFVTLDKIAQADTKYTDVLLLENYASFQNRYYELQIQTLLINLMCSVCSVYYLDLIFYFFLYSWPGWNIQSVWPGQCRANSSKILSPSKWILWTSLHTPYKHYHIHRKCSLSYFGKSKHNLVIIIFMRHLLLPFHWILSFTILKSWKNWMIFFVHLSSSSFDFCK